MSQIPTKDQNPNGLHARYHIQKIDGWKEVKNSYSFIPRYEAILKPVDKNAEYFIMRLDDGGKDAEHIKACRIGVNAYADAIEHHLPELAKDLRERYPLPVEHPEGAIGEGWINVEDSPLFTKDEKDNWICTDNGSGAFLAAVPLIDNTRPEEKNLWWIMPCVVEDGIGLCIIGDEENTPAGWQLEDVTKYKLLDLTPPSNH